MDEEQAKRQFLIFAMLRISGVAMVIAGVFIAFTDVLRTGGWPVPGFILVIAGVIDAVIAPRLVKRGMERE